MAAIQRLQIPRNESLRVENYGIWEVLERILQKAGHFLGGLPKVQVAREVAATMDPDRNTSKSFQALRDGVRGP
jgi:hypothetical protein